MTPHFVAERFRQLARGPEQTIVPYPPMWIPSRLVPVCEMLEALQLLLGRPIVVLDGYRSPEYHDSLYDLAEEGVHTQGIGVCMAAPPVSPEYIVAAALRVRRRGLHPIGTIIRYPQFVHLDLVPRAVPALLVAGARRTHPRQGLSPREARETLCIGCGRAFVECICPVPLPKPLTKTETPL